MFETCPLLEDLPWLKHGFFQRLPTMPNTYSEKQGNSPFLDALGVGNADLYFCRHVFQDRIITPAEWQPGIEADAWITDQPFQGLAVKTADCVPLILVCPQTRLIANIHVSWHCVLNEIVPKTLQLLQISGADLSTLIAAIGPCIHQQSYPVGQDLYDKFKAEAPSKLGFFRPFEDRWQLDVNGMVKNQLADAGVKHIWRSPFDTFTSAEHYSFRKRLDDPDSTTLRNVSVVIRIA